MTEYCEKHGLDPLKLPRHIGIIMDGNGRWAVARKLPRVAGHRKGAERVSQITEAAGRIGIQALTLYAFSDENWRRPEDEVGALMGLLRWYLRSEKRRILDNNVQFRVIGDRQKLSSDILTQIVQLEEASRNNTGLQLNIGISYGSRGEIVRAVKRIISKVEAGEVFPNDIDEDMIDKCLDTAGLPPVDMLIRTSGEMRISNYLLWQIAYAELFFDNTLWPDFSEDHFARLLSEYAARERRFGMTSAQVARMKVATNVRT